MNQVIQRRVGEESRIPSVTTPGVRMAKKALKTPDNNNGVRRLTYDGFVAHYYAYMVRVIQEVEPTCF
jgi:hypothetical protein